MDQEIHVKLICPDDAAIEQRYSLGRNIPSQGDTLSLDGVRFLCDATEWTILSGWCTVTVHLSMIRPPEEVTEEVTQEFTEEPVEESAEEPAAELQEQPEAT